MGEALMASAASEVPLPFWAWLHSAAAVRFQCASPVLAVLPVRLHSLVDQYVAAQPAAPQPLPVLLPSAGLAVATEHLATATAADQWVVDNPADWRLLAGPYCFQWRVD